MSAIARILLDRGLEVSGSDAKGSHVVTGLTARGVRTAVGQRAENLDLLDGGPTAVVISTAIRPDNPELVAARERGIPVVRRAFALAALMAGYRSVCVAGTHGKTSTTSMLTVALQHAGVDPSFAIGGELNESGTGRPPGLAATSSSPRPTRATGRSWPSTRTAPSSPTSSPTTWTTTAPPRPTPRCSTTSCSGIQPGRVPRRLRRRSRSARAAGRRSDVGAPRVIRYGTQPRRRRRSG